MYIQRDIDKTLQQWKEEKKHKPLLLRGVRQCGKTSAVRHLSEQFENYIEINFEKHSELCSLFEGNFVIKANKNSSVKIGYSKDGNTFGVLYEYNVT